MPQEIPQWEIPVTVPSVVTEVQSQFQPQQISEPEPDLSLGEGFLRNIPEQDRAIVAKYVRDWDGNVTRRFQELHTTYEPYKELGELTEVQQAVALNQFLHNDPVTFYRLLEETLDEMKEKGLLEMAEDEFEEVAVEEYDDPNQQILAELQELRQWRDQQDQSAQDKADMAELDNLIQVLHNKHDDFDEDWVLLQISRGVDPDEAVTQFHSMIEARAGSFRKVSPPLVMGGNGQIPGNQADLTKMTTADRIKYVAATLAANNG